MLHSTNCRQLCANKTAYDTHRQPGHPHQAKCPCDRYQPFNPKDTYFIKTSMRWCCVPAYLGCPSHCELADG